MKPEDLAAFLLRFDEAKGEFSDLLSELFDDYAAKVFRLLDDIEEWVYDEIRRQALR